MSDTTRLSLIEAAWVVARRDFKAVLFSRTFFFFLLGPLFPILVGMLAGGIGGQVQRDAVVNTVAFAMSAEDNAAIAAASEAAQGNIELMPKVEIVPEEVVSAEGFSPRDLLSDSNYSVVVTGPLDKPVITGPHPEIHRWDGTIATLAAMARGTAPSSFPDIVEETTDTTAAGMRTNRIRTAQAGQLVLFLLMMLLAGMVLSNLVEEKANKVIEVLAAAIPMDAVFLGKLFAMLAVSFVGVFVWGTFGLAVALLAGNALPQLPEPALGWPLFITLTIVYFAMGYLLLGSLFLTIGGMATTVREVQTLSMPITMAQLLVFFVAAAAITRPGSPMEIFSAIFPFSSPFAMLARAAQNEALWPHGLAIVWQLFCVILFVRVGAAIFRRRVMKSGKAGREKKGRIGATKAA